MFKKNIDNKTFNKHLVSVHLAVFLFGSAGLFGKLLPISPFIIVFGRVFFAAIALFLFKLGKSCRCYQISLGNLPKFVLLGFVLAVHWVTFFTAIQVSTVAVGLITFSTFPIFVAFMEPFFFKRRLMTADILFSLIAFMGVILIIPEYSLENRIFEGAVWGTISGLTFAILSILNKKYVINFSSTYVAFYQNIFASVFLLPFLFLNFASLEIKHLILLIILGVIFTALSHSFFIFGLKKITAATASIIAVLEPFYGIILAAVFLQEIPNLRTIGGGALILSVVVFKTHLEMKKK